MEDIQIEEALTPREIDILMALSQAISSAVSEYNGALKTVVSIHALPGNWRFDPQSGKLLRKSDEV